MKRGYFVVCIISILLVGAFVSAATIWTTDIDGNPKLDYGPYEMVYIHGTGFNEDADVALSITWPDDRVIYGTAYSYGTGYFLYEYQLYQGLEGPYYVDATDGVNTAETIFTDAKGAVWTRRDSCTGPQNENAYGPGDQIYLDVEGFDPSTSYAWDITGQPSSCDGSTIIASGNYVTDENGSACFFAYTVLVDDCGVYKYTYDGKTDNYHIACVDRDDDGYDSYSAECTSGDDCDDTNPDIHPGATEICNNVDDDCDGQIDGITEPCGAGDCVGESLCTAGVWGDCSSLGNSCEDGEYCTVGDTCDASGTCMAGSARNIDDGVSCTDDYCDEEFDAVINTPNDGYCSNGLWCDGVEYCDEDLDCQAGTPVDCSQYTDQCNLGVCDEPSDSCVAQPDNEGYPCDDGLFCNGGETCQSGICTGGADLDCSTFDLPVINTCEYTPDGLSYTRDTYAGFTSICLEESDECTTSQESITSVCDQSCGAECENDGHCGDKCVDEVFYSGGSCDLGDCACDYTTEDCDQYDDWYDTENYQWINTDECNEKEQVEQEYRDYYCDVQGCGYSVTDNRWQDTGSTRYEQQGITCDDGLYCTVNDVCDGAGVCDGGNRDCSAFDNECNLGFCDEDADTCDVDPEPINLGEPCTSGVGECEAFGTINCEETCDAIPGQPSTEVCDNLDNDCDGAIDEDLSRGCSNRCFSGDEICSAGVWGSCDATPEPVNYGEPCSVGVGECYAEGTIDCTGECDAIQGQASPEVCDGLDNNCDGQVDEGFGTTPTSCGVGECSAVGELACIGGEWLDDCSPGSPSSEICDGLDNDCDGLYDEDLGTTPTTCGVGQCFAQGQEACVGGFWVDDCTPGAPSAEVCDALDNDCDGAIDEGLTQSCDNICFSGTEYCEIGYWVGCDATPVPQTYGNACSVGQGECYAEGTIDCDELCDAVEGTPETEICDGLDNDCDGDVDEDLGSTPIFCGVGECYNTGLEYCAQGAWFQDCMPGTPTTEVCDNLDNDCDGDIDEGLGTNPTSCGVGECSSAGEEACVGGVWVDDCTPGAPSAEVCDALDNDCDDLIDEDLTQGCSNACFQGTEYCEFGYWVGCDADSEPQTYGDFCSVGQGECYEEGTVQCDESCSVVEGTPETEVCDGLDNDCDGAVDEGVCEYCGDGIIQPPEECDDGNDNNDDYCSNGCMINAGGSGTGITFETEEFVPLIWGCDSRIVLDDNVEWGRISIGGEELLERTQDYAFEGEQIAWQVLVMDKNGIEKIEDVYVSVGPVQGTGSFIEANCDLAPSPGSIIPIECNARIDEEELYDFDANTMALYNCILTVESPASMHGEFWITANVVDLDSQLGVMDENEFWFLNPVIAVTISGTPLNFGVVRPGTQAYSNTITVGNGAELGSGVMMDMFITGTDFTDPSHSGAKCPITNQLSLGTINYFAVNGAYSTLGLGDFEGYMPIQYGDSFSTLLYDFAEVIPAGPLPGGYSAGNVLSPGSEMSVTFRLALPEPCNGDFTDGSIFFWGEAI